MTPGTKEPHLHHRGGYPEPAVNVPSKEPYDEVTLAKVRLRQLYDEQDVLNRFKPPKQTWMLGGGAALAGIIFMRAPVFRAAVKLGILWGIRQAVARYLRRIFR